MVALGDLPLDLFYMQERRQTPLLKQRLSGLSITGS